MDHTFAFDELSSTPSPAFVQEPSPSLAPPFDDTQLYRQSFVDSSGAFSTGGEAASPEQPSPQQPFFTSDQYVTDHFGSDLHQDYHFTSSSAHTASGIDPSHTQEAYWCPSPDGSLPTSSSLQSTFLSDLYGESLAVPSDAALTPSRLSGSSSPSWPSSSDTERHSQFPQPHLYSSAAQEHHLIRRASFPTFGTHDRTEDVLPPVSSFIFDNSDLHAPQPLSREPNELLGERMSGYKQEEYHYHPQPSHKDRESTFIHIAPQDFEEGRTRSDGGSPTAQGQSVAFCGPPSPGSPRGPHLMMALPPGVQITHTDDAASKETQYLRRRCFNCRTTEPPSWRRSTLNPGKIVCNKCGLYERTHLRPRPHRFDELRGGTKNRKVSQKLISIGAGPVSPNRAYSKMDSMGLGRRESMPSIGAVAKEWEESSVYSASSSSSTPPFPSPGTTSFKLLPQQSPLAPPTVILPSPPTTHGPAAVPKKSSTLPPLWSAPSFGSFPSRGNPPPSLNSYGRRESFDVVRPGMHRRPTIPVETGWQTIPIEDFQARASKPAHRRNVIAA